MFCTTYLLATRLTYLLATRLSVLSTKDHFNHLQRSGHILTVADSISRHTMGVGRWVFCRARRQTLFHRCRVRDRGNSNDVAGAAAAAATATAAEAAAVGRARRVVTGMGGHI